jgi:stage III sporulation protein AG
MEILKRLRDKVFGFLTGEQAAKSTEDVSPRKKIKFENIIIIAIAGILLIITGKSLTTSNTELNDGQTVEKLAEVRGEESANPDQGAEEKLEQRFSAMLSKIEGAGKVDVMVVIERGAQLTYVQEESSSSNFMTETDTAGGSRETSSEQMEKKPAYKDVDGIGMSPILENESAPVLKGVVVIADGASNIVVKDRLLTAVQVLTDLPIHKIAVMKRAT